MIWMPYLIDGHNLIPKIPGLHLSAVNDEMRLVELLQEFCRLSRKKVEVYFDQAAQGQAGQRKLGTVAAHFVPVGSTADEAIMARLHKMGRAARNWTVVSSDQRVLTTAHQAGAQTLTSEEFARTAQTTLASDANRKSVKAADTRLSQDEVEEWLEIFKSKPDQRQ
jgi:predicted RNA-binding protein with PIN domain